jgi:3D (Asp-Asp-Asp) domain-containing protein
MFIEGYGFAVAADTGSAILGKTIDVYFNTRREACSWGVKHPTVYVLK